MIDIAGVDVVPIGTHSLHIRLDGFPTATVAAELRALNLEGVSDVVPAESTMLVRCEHESARRNAVVKLNEILSVVDVAERKLNLEPLEIEVDYNGEDLEVVARACEMSVEEVIYRHLNSEFVAAFCGFAPGFAYLAGLDPLLHLPRRETPRTRVPAGSVSIAAMYSAVYPNPSPGGWHLLGTTDATLWNVESNPPALIEPGRRVRFVRKP
ncbi:MAG: 5-oxoprolinase subunit B family protein [Ilumatobacteraceae bacterium]